MPKMAKKKAETRAGEGKIEAARTALRAIVAELAAVRAGLNALHDSIPPSPEETADIDLPAELDVLTEIRMVTEIVLGDRIDPLIETLSAAAEYRQAVRT
jgi:hypothetical protein